MRVKKLEWIIRSYDPDHEVAETPFGQYAITKTVKEKFIVEFYLGPSCRRIPSEGNLTLQEAKALAQKDFSDRLWDCFELEFKGYTHATLGYG
jgi:hypothetical protein